MVLSGTSRVVKTAAPLFAALGDETRLRVVARLSREGPLSIARITDGSRVTRQAVTKHLRVLRQAGLVRSARDGRASVWKIDPRKLDEAQDYLSLISQEWDSALLRLKAFVEE